MQVFAMVQEASGEWLKLKDAEAAKVRQAAEAVLAEAIATARAAGVDPRTLLGIKKAAAKRTGHVNPVYGVATPEERAIRRDIRRKCHAQGRPYNNEKLIMAIRNGVVTDEGFFLAMVL